MSQSRRKSVAGRALWLSCVVALLGSGLPSLAQDCQARLLPDPLAAGGEASCQYRHVPFAGFQYDGGKIRATWSARYEVLQSFVVADWKLVALHVPGLALNLSRDPGASRYDFVQKMRERETGEEFLALTPIWCRQDGEFVEAPTEGCGNQSPQGCSTRDSTTCADGTVVAVECDGDTGTCETCGDSTSACCKSSEVKTVVLPNGTVIQMTTLTSKNLKCK